MSRRRTTIVVGVSVAALMVMAATAGVVVILMRSGDDTTTPPASETTATNEVPPQLEMDVPKGFEAVVDDEAGFAIALPNSWERFDLTDPEVQDVFQDFADANPEIAPAMDQALEAMGEGGLLYAIDPDWSAGRTVSVLVQPGEAPLPQVEAALRQELTSLGIDNLEIGLAPVTEGLALRTDYDIALDDPSGGTVSGHVRQFLLPESGSMWTVTFGSGDFQDDEPTFDRIIESFTVAA
jgi:hypothetical protein